jgi:hypothetical protein
VHSGGFRGFTVVTVVTLVFAPFFNHHQWMWKLVGRSEQTEIKQCVVDQPCPRHERIVNVVTVPAPTTTPDPFRPGPGKHDH